MATVKNARKPRRVKAASFGLLANGSSGTWEIAIDESLRGPDRWQAQIEGPSVTLSFEVSSPSVVGAMLRFLESNESRAPLILSKDKKSAVFVAKDDEYEDRYFLLTGRVDRPIVRLVLTGADIQHIRQALRQVQDDIDAD